MRNYVIINGVNSLTIQGLAIKTLPPITKPIQRNLREEIDGRDGDIVTTLGYGAYDKTIEIGLFGTFDIDEVIAYFNQKGTITFSNEADKVYYFEALDQVDYAELLKFRTANVVLHCQPFKYPLNETPLVEEYEYVEATGTNVTLDNTSEAIFNKFDLKGNTSQASTPTPSSPIPVNVVSGDNTIGITGKNIFDYTTTEFANPGRVSIETSNNTITITTLSETTNGDLFFRTKIPDELLTNGETYTITSENVSGVYKNLKLQLRNKDGSAAGLSNGTSITYDNKYSLFVVENPFALYNTTVVPAGSVCIIKNVMVRNANITDTTYEPYIGKSYPIYLGVEGNVVDTLYNTQIGSNGGITSNTARVANVNIGGTSNLYLQAGTYTLSIPNLDQCTCLTKNSGGTILDNFANSWQTLPFTFTLTQAGYLYFTGRKSNSSTITPSDYTAQVNQGSQVNYVSDNPIELCKIGTYQDYIYKDNGSWYLHKEIGKVVLDGSESGWSYPSANRFNLDNILSEYYKKDAVVTYNSNYYQGYNQTGSNANFNNEVANVDYGFNLSWAANSNTIRFKDTRYTSLNDFTTWLSNNNVSVYYILATPTNTLIEDTTLIEQLESLSIANSIQGQTNISQTNNDLPFILSVSTLKDGSDHLVINNIGNIYAKPTLDLEGNGIVDIYLNDTQMFEVDLSETNEIVINTQDMEAYNPTTNALANRQVTGDYSKFKLDSGENDLRFSGALTKATITRYERWL